MDQQRAIRVFRELEESRYEDLCYDDGRLGYEPIWDVRLDAYTDFREGGIRAFRIRVTTGALEATTQHSYRDILDIAEREGNLTLTLENDGIMLR